MRYKKPTDLGRTWIIAFISVINATAMYNQPSFWCILIATAVLFYVTVDIIGVYTHF